MRSRGPQRSTFNPQPNMTGWIGVSLGDITGIGPEVTLKALALEAQADNTRYLLIGDAEHARRLNEQLGLKLPLQTYADKDEPGQIFLCQPLPDALPVDLFEGSPAAARAAIGSSPISRSTASLVRLNKGRPIIRFRLNKSPTNRRDRQSSRRNEGISRTSSGTSNDSGAFFSRTRSPVRCLAKPDQAFSRPGG